MPSSLPVVVQHWLLGQRVISNRTRMECFLSLAILTYLSCWKYRFVSYLSFVYNAWNLQNLHCDWGSSLDYVVYYANVQKHEVLFFVLKILELPQEVDVVAVLITALSWPTPAIRVVPKPYCLEVRPRRTSNEFSSRWLSEIVGYSNMADYSSSTVVGRALILPVLSCNDVYVILSRILNKTCRQDWPITARRAEIRHVGTRVNWRQFFTDRSGKYFITVAVSSPKTTCVTADHVRPNKFPMNRPIIYHLSHDNSHLLRDIFILSHDQWDLLQPFWNHWWSLLSDSDWL